MCVVKHDSYPIYQAAIIVKACRGTSILAIPKPIKGYYLYYIFSDIYFVYF